MPSPPGHSPAQPTAGNQPSPQPSGTRPSPSCNTIATTNPGTAHAAYMPTRNPTSRADPRLAAEIQPTGTDDDHDGERHREQQHRAAEGGPDERQQVGIEQAMREASAGRDPAQPHRVLVP